RDKELSEDLSVLYAGIEALDRRCGDIFDQLKELELTRHTLVLVLSDCGPEAVEGRFNSGLYGTQGSLHEGGLRVPAIWSWQGVIPQGAIVHRICHHTDVFATLLGVAGAPIPNDRAIHGLNIAPLLLFGDDARWPNRNLGSVLVPGRDLDGASRSYRTTRWAAVLDPDWRRVEPGAEDERWELYDLMADPRQHYNVAGAYPFVLAGLKSDIAHWFHKSQVFGYPVIPSVLESTPIRLDPRSAVYPASWEGPKPLDRVKGWDEAGFSASWPIVYRRSGKVRLSVEYRLPDVSARLVHHFGIGNPVGVDVPSSAEWRTEKTEGEIVEAGAFDFVVRTERPASGLELREIRVEFLD
ncbi:MAG: sulfatase-like hydrolase/transferase, partial [Verrucomicrobiota bacterium]